MTVKEFREVLAACNDDAEVIMHSSDGLCILEDENVFQIFDLADEGTVILSTRKEADTIHEAVKRG